MYVYDKGQKLEEQNWKLKREVVCALVQLACVHVCVCVIFSLLYVEF